MPFKYSYTKNRFFCLFTDIVTWEDLFSAIGNLYGGKNLDEINEILVVFSENTNVVVSDSNAQEMAYLDKAAMRYNPNLNFALVASTPSARSLCLNYIRYSREIGNTWNYQLFNSLEEATGWLDYQKEQEKLYH